MAKYLSILFLFSFFMAGEAFARKNCVGDVLEILRSSSEIGRLLKLRLSSAQSLGLEDVVIKELEKAFLQKNIYLNSKTGKFYIYFIANLPASKRLQAAKELVDAFLSFPNSRYARKFQNKMANLRMKKRSLKWKHVKRLRGEFPNSTEYEIDQMAEAIAKREVNYYEELCFNCVIGGPRTSSKTAEINIEGRKILYQKRMSDAKKILYPPELIGTLINTESIDNVLDIISVKLKEFPEFVDTKTIKRYLYFIESLSDKERVLAARELDQAFVDFPRGEFAKKFKVIQRTVESRRERIEKNLYAKARSENRHLDDVEVEDLIKKDAKRASNDFERQFTRCRASRKTPELERSLKEYKSFTLKVIPTTAGAMYFAQNVNETYEDGSLGAWGKFGAGILYEAAWGWATAKVLNKIMTVSDPSTIRYALKNYGVSRLRGLAELGTYPLFTMGMNTAFGMDAEMNGKISRIMESEERVEILKKLEKRIEEQNLVEKLGTSMKDMFRQMIDLANSSDSKPTNDLIGTIDWKKLTHEDLEDPSIRAFLVAAITLDNYDNVERKGEDYFKDYYGINPFQSGNMGLDRWSARTTSSALLIAGIAGLNLRVKRILCMGQNNMLQAKARAYIEYSIGKFTIDQLHGMFRKPFVGH